MKQTRRRFSSLGRPGPWLAVAGGLVVYVLYVVFLDGTWPFANLGLPWWAAQIVPPLVYGLLVRLLVRPLSPLRWAIATCSLWGVHLAVGVLTSASMSGFGWDAIVTAFPPPPWPAIFWAPLLLLPLRDVIAGDPLVRRQPSMTDHRPTAPGTSGQAWMTARPVTGWPAVPAPSVDDDAGAARKLSVTTGDERKSLLAEEAGAEDVAVLENPPRPDVAVGTKSAMVTGCLTEMLSPDTSSVHVRVSLERIAGQLPAEVFLVPLAQVGAALPEPGRLLVPEPLVLAQLPEGYVSVGWGVVAAQFPRQALAMTNEEIAARLPNGHVVLPLDELLPQLSRELFSTGASPVHLEGIENFPAPFQPAALEERTDELAGAFLLNGSRMADADGATRAPAAPVESGADHDASAERGRVDIPSLEDIELDPQLLVDTEHIAHPVLEAASPKLEAASDANAVAAASERADAREADAHDVANGEEEPPGHHAVETPTTALGPVSPPQPSSVDAAADPLVAAPVLDAGDDSMPGANGDRASVAPHEPFDLGADDLDDVELVMASIPGLHADSALATARQLLPLLAADRLPWTVTQLTMRGPNEALVLTPVAPMTQGGSVLVSTVMPGESLALVELQALRAAVDQPRNGHRDRRARIAEGGLEAEPDSVETEPPAFAHEIAASLDAIEPVAPATLRRATAAEDSVYLFLPRGSDLQKVGRFARAVERVLRHTAESGHRFQAVVARCGTRRLIVQALDDARECPCLVVVGGETNRPGLAYRQAAQARQRLATR